MGIFVVWCDRCGYFMRIVDCFVCCYVLVVMEVIDGSFVYVIVFNDVLEKLVFECKNFSDGEVEEVLLLMENVMIMYDSEIYIVLNVVIIK